jgi:hypothetical protein
MIPTNQIAQVYDWTLVASLLGRCEVCLQQPASRSVLEPWCAQLLEMLFETASGKPILPRFDAKAVTLARAEVAVLRQRLSGVAPAEMLPLEQRRHLDDHLRGREDALDQLASRVADAPDDVATASDIGRMFEMPKLLEDGAAVARLEFERFRDAASRPKADPELRNRVSGADIEAAMTDVARVLGAPTSSRVQVKRGAPGGRHLSWALGVQFVEYFVPDSLELADFLTWDFPHNFAHLAHLAAYASEGVTGYIDRMNERAYHESVAVFAEHLALDALSERDSRAWSVLRERWVGWMIAKRRHEFMLRAVRLLADTLGVAGASYAETVAVICDATHVARPAVEAEVNRYYATLGLGATYTVGCRRLEELAEPFCNCIVDSRGRAVRTWAQRGVQ